MGEGSQNGYLDRRTIDWPRVRSAIYEVRQLVRYEYPGPIHDVHHMLMLVPADLIGRQRLLCHRVRVEPEARPRYSEDQFGNRICHVALPEVIGALEFHVSFHVERTAGDTVTVTDPAEREWYLEASPLTEASPALQTAADQLHAGATGPSELAERINRWVYRHISYTHEATGVRTTAADVLTIGKGVCQDYAHLMIAICRLNGLPARYVSGHLLGEGTMHAWTEVLLPAADGEAWQAFDPTHDCRAGMPYITVAVGRDYGDVSHTRGSFRAPYSGQLAGGSKQAGVLRVQLDEPAPSV